MHQAYIVEFPSGKRPPEAILKIDGEAICRLVGAQSCI